MKRRKRKSDLYKILLLSGAVACLILTRILGPAGASQAPPPEAQEEARQETEAGSDKVNVNTGSIEELMTLPGVGEKTAKSIIEQRTAEGPFKSTEDLLQVRGIGIRKLKKLEPFIVLK